jgi:cytochrome c6
MERSLRRAKIGVQGGLRTRAARDWSGGRPAGPYFKRYLLACGAVVVALSGGQKLGLLAVAAVFIGFALASSFLFPRTNPDFPGRRLPLFVGVTVLLFVAMLTAMAVLAVEDEEETGHAAEPAASESAEPSPPPAQPPAAEGDAEAGKAVFASAGCGGCHTLTDAGSSGAVGPNLDEATPDHELVVERVTNGKGAMPSFKDSLSEEQIQDVAAYVVQATSS